MYLSHDIIEKALTAIEKYPLCDHCLGRLFARVGYALENYERGRALKDVIFLMLHRSLQKCTEDTCREEILRKITHTQE